MNDFAITLFMVGVIIFQISVMMRLNKLETQIKKWDVTK
jgi:hypothetical protein